MENSNSEDLCGVVQNEECRIDDPASTSSSYRLFGRQASVHQMMGGGKAADVILWRRRRASFGILLVATFSWLLIERSGISFLSLCSDVLLILIVLLFLKANYAVLRKKQPKTLPELVLSEEMVNNAAASFRVKINYMLLMAHDITLGKDFRLFFKPDIFLHSRIYRYTGLSLVFYLLYDAVPFVDLLILEKAYNIAEKFILLLIFYTDALGIWSDQNPLIFLQFTIGKAGIILSITIPALYDKFEDHVDRFAGMIHRKFSKHYKIVDESLQSRLPRILAKEKDP
ncbi:UNVERIFIED_CONTAM: Reticulon-like protein B16 [Sesamum latifolium]|uniref:Reticulon-like protein n=1 Tax=Sesamum latifolium TaxID=2727402 RepID=A0AAW2XII8_9LAMI